MQVNRLAPVKLQRQDAHPVAVFSSIQDYLPLIEFKRFLCNRLRNFLLKSSNNINYLFKFISIFGGCFLLIQIIVLTQRIIQNIGISTTARG